MPKSRKEDSGLMREQPRVGVMVERDRAHGRGVLEGIADYQLKETSWRVEPTGSHQPELASAVSESLAGRTGVCELLPSRGRSRALRPIPPACVGI